MGPSSLFLNQPSGNTLVLYGGNSAKEDISCSHVIMISELNNDVKEGLVEWHVPKWANLSQIPNYRVSHQIVQHSERPLIIVGGLELLPKDSVHEDCLNGLNAKTQIASHIDIISFGELLREIGLGTSKSNAWTKSLLQQLHDRYSKRFPFIH